MKITPLTDAMKFLNTVRQKPEGQGGRGGGAHHEQSRKDGDAPPSPSSSFDEQAAGSQQDETGSERQRAKVEAAVTAFKGDQQTLANGIEAQLIGNGPGLKVVVRDATGRVLRQYSGEEFLRMREATSKDGRARGKILDQKF